MHMLRRSMSLPQTSATHTVSHLHWRRLQFIIFTLVFSHISLSIGSETTQITFPEFSANDTTTMRAFGDVQFNVASHSMLLNTNSAADSTGTCALLLYGKTDVQIQDSASGTVASFTTSFTFKFISPPHEDQSDHFNASDTVVRNTVAFVVTSGIVDQPAGIQALQVWADQSGPCKSYTQRESYFGVVFDADYNPYMGDPSNNFVGVVDGMSDPIFKEGYTHNLCGDNGTTHCSCLSNGGSSFTAWIDLTPQRTLQVWLANGSENSKPLTPVLELPNFELPSKLGDYVSLTFLGSSGEAHELSSWSFFSSGLPDMVNPNNSPAKREWVRRMFWAGGTVATVVILVVLGVFSLWLTRHRRRLICSPTGRGPRVFKYKELSYATKNFSDNEKLGSGGFGTVYKGSIKSSSSDGIDTTTLVAVKRINYNSKHAERTFLAEISSLGQIRHGNVVPLQGWCHEKRRLLLVYDYMPNGSLNEWLHGSLNRAVQLPWKLRHRILEGVAAAVEYLHKDCPQCVLHRDIKSSNVMLDADFKPYLGDFGLARLTDHHKVEKTTMAAGTVGYMAPEIPYTGKATKESDVYSFGILVLEVVCGRRPLDLKKSEPEDLVLLYRVWQAHEAGSLLSVADPRLQTFSDFPPFSLQTVNIVDSFSLDVEVIGEVNNVQTSSDSLAPVSWQTVNSGRCSPDVEVIGEVNNVQTSSDSLGPGSLQTVNVDSCLVPDEEVIDEVKNAEGVVTVMVRSLLRLGLLCCLPNPKARPTMAQVIRILQQMGDIDNARDALSDYVISMPPLPDVKPLGLYRSIEFSQVVEDAISQGQGLPIELRSSLESKATADEIRVTL